MRVLIISDVHGNGTALRAVLEAVDFDRCWFLGDAIDLGPHPVECLRTIYDVSDVRLMGNHDRAVLEWDPADDGDGPHTYSKAWTKRQLNETDLQSIAETPRTRTVTATDSPAGTSRHDLPRSAEGETIGSVRLHHGDFVPATAPLDEPWKTRVHPEEAPAFYRSVIERYPEPVVFCGHSHLQFDLTLDGTRLVNPGSVGYGRSWADPHPGLARFAILEDGEVTFEEAPYDLEAACQAAQSVGWHEATASLVEGIYCDGG